MAKFELNMIIFEFLQIHFQSDMSQSIYTYEL